MTTSQIINNFYFVAYCSTGDVFIPIRYIIDFIEKYKNKYSDTNTNFIVCTESRHHCDLKYYNTWFNYAHIIPYSNKNLYYDNHNFYVYYWCRHIDNITSPTDLYGFSHFFKQLFTKFELELNPDLSAYIPKLSLLPNIESKKAYHYNKLIEANNTKKTNKTIFFINCDALSTPFNRSAGYNIDILLNLMASYIEKNNMKYTIIASHKYPCNYNKNIIFLTDILNKPQHCIEIMDFQLQSYYSDIIIGTQTGVIILCQFYENKNKTFMMSDHATMMYPDINTIFLPKPYGDAYDIIIKELLVKSC